MTYVVEDEDLTDESIQFTFTVKGVDYKIPFMQYIPLPVLEAAQKRGGVGHVPVLLELGLKDAADAWLTLSPNAMKKLTAAWTEASAASLGESKAS